MPVEQNSQPNSTPAVRPGNYSPVTVYLHDSIGAIFLGIFAVVFLFKWLSAEARLNGH